jgi:hypothetical protein
MAGSGLRYQHRRANYGPVPGKPSGAIISARGAVALPPIVTVLLEA